MNTFSFDAASYAVASTGVDMLMSSAEGVVGRPLAAAAGPVAAGWVIGITRKMTDYGLLSADKTTSTSWLPTFTTK